MYGRTTYNLFLFRQDGEVDATALNEFIARFNLESFWVATEVCLLGGI
jgi:hypothetical protein